MSKKIISIFLLALFLAGSFICTNAHAQTNCYQSISAGTTHTLALKADGTLWAWGDNRFGELGLGNTINMNNPVKIMEDVKFASAGLHVSMAIKTDNSLWAWGANYNGHLGDGTQTDRNLPVKIMDDAASVFAGQFCAFAIKTDGSLWAWGDNSYGQLGDGTFTEQILTSGSTTFTVIKDNNRLSPVKIMDDVRTVAADGQKTMAVKTDGTLWAWGAAASGTFVVDENIPHNKSFGLDYPRSINPTPQKIMDDVYSVSISTDIMIIKSDGGLWTWSNSYYSGSGTPLSHINGMYKILDDVTTVSQGNKFGMAIKKDGSLWAWGENNMGELGDGNSGGSETKFEDGIDSPIPKKIMDDVISVSTGNCHTIALKKDGSLWAWGNYSLGKLGNGMGGGNDSPAVFYASFISTPVKIIDDVIIPIDAPKPTIPAPVSPVIATPTASPVFIDGKLVGFDAYTIDGNNYFKLRDLAYVLNSTDKKFAVTYDSSKNAIMLTSDAAYIPSGGEMMPKSTGVKSGIQSTSRVFLNYRQIAITAYTIDGNNYFKLRDIGKAFNFGVIWDDKNKSISIDTMKEYTP